VNSQKQTIFAENCERKRMKESQNIKLSIIVPVYNVERYIRPCFESIFKQGLDDSDFEVIIVNDGTKDKSMEMIANIISDHKNIIVINQENHGLSIARNNGLAKAIGEYILFVDSDDLLIRQSVPILLNKAFETKADLVIADYLKKNDVEIASIQNVQQEIFKMDIGIGQESFLTFLDPHDCHVWKTLYRREFLIYNHITFPPHIYFEDIPFTHECYIKAKKTIKTNQLLYIYRVGNTSITHPFNKKKGIDFGVSITKTWELTSATNLSPETYNKIKDNVFFMFSFLCFVISHEIKNPTDRIEILNHIMRIAPEMHFSNGYKQKIVNFMFHRMPSIYIGLRVLYGNSIEKEIWKWKRTIKH
jgi:glycosyltransferase involved in cell wall biosynthesis